MAVSESCPGWKRLLVTLVQNDPEQDGALPTYDVTGGMADVELIAGKFIQRVCPVCWRSLAFQNNVSAPKPPFCLVHGVTQERDMLNVDEWDEAGENLTRGQLATFTVQADFYGKGAHALSGRVATLWRSDVGPDIVVGIREGWAPLYAKARRFQSYEDESGNSQERWLVTLKMNECVTCAETLAESVDIRVRPLV